MGLQPPIWGPTPKHLVGHQAVVAGDHWQRHFEQPLAAPWNWPRASMPLGFGAATVLVWCRVLVRSRCSCLYIWDSYPKSGELHPGDQSVCYFSSQCYYPLTRKKKEESKSFGGKTKVLGCLFAEPDNCPQMVGILMIWMTICLIASVYTAVMRQELRASFFLAQGLFLSFPVALLGCTLKRLSQAMICTSWWPCATVASIP